jgi:hypothetical protein
MSVRNQKPGPIAKGIHHTAPTLGSKTQKRKAGKQTHQPFKK